MLEKPKLTIHSTHCGENVVTQDERSGSESFSMVSRETSGRERWQRKSDQTLHYTKGDCFDGRGSVECERDEMTGQTHTHTLGYTHAHSHKFKCTHAKSFSPRVLKNKNLWIVDVKNKVFKNLIAKYVLLAKFQM